MIWTKTIDCKKETVQIIDIKIDFVTLKNGKKSNHTG
jgi:hypothetical protein